MVTAKQRSNRRTSWLRPSWIKMPIKSVAKRSRIHQDGSPCNGLSKIRYFRLAQGRRAADGGPGRDRPKLTGRDGDRDSQLSETRAVCGLATLSTKSLPSVW